MTTTTVSDVNGIIRTWVHEPTSSRATKFANARFGDFTRKRIANKEYGFLHYSNPNTWVARYKCSWPEADRRFALMLVTRRLKA